MPVSYTHLDVYKRQHVIPFCILNPFTICNVMEIIFPANVIAGKRSAPFNPGQCKYILHRTDISSAYYTLSLIPI